MDGGGSRLATERTAQFQIEDLIRKETKRRFEHLVLVISFFSLSILIFSYQLFLWQTGSLLYHDNLPTTNTAIFTLVIDMLLAAALTFGIYIMIWATRK